MAARKPLVTITGRTRELPTTDSLAVNTQGWPLVRNSVAAGETLTIPVGYQFICSTVLTVNATGLVDNAGDLVIL